MQDISVVLIVVSVIILVLGGVLYVFMLRRGAPALHQEKYQAKWLSIEHSLQRDQPHSYQVAIMNADKLLDQALRERGVHGNTMGERMKAAQALWTSANYVWGAHKVRNQIAHESDYVPSYEIAQRALVAYKQGLKDLGAI